MNNWLFGGGGQQQSGVQWPPRGPGVYQPQNLVYGNSPWYGGAGTSATDPSSVPGYQGPPGPSGTQGGVKGPNPWPGQQNNPFDFFGNMQNPPPVQPQPQNNGGVTITINPGGTQTSPPSSSPQASGQPVTSAPPAAPPPPQPVAPPPEPVNEWGRTAKQQAEWQAQADAEQAIRTAQLKASDDLALQQVLDTEAAARKDEIMRQGRAAFTQWEATEMLKQAELKRQWEQHFANVAAMPAPDWNMLPVFQIIKGLQDPAAFQARGKIAEQALAGPTMPQAPQMPGMWDLYPPNEWTLQEDPETKAMVAAAMDRVGQGYTDLNHFITTGAPKPPPIKLDLPDAHKIQYHDFANLMPTEVALLESGLRSQGINPTDYFTQLERSTPRGRGFSGTGWG